MRSAITSFFFFLPGDFWWEGRTFGTAMRCVAHAVLLARVMSVLERLPLLEIFAQAIVVTRASTQT